MPCSRATPLRRNQREYEQAGMLLEYVSYAHNGRHINSSQSVATSVEVIRNFAIEHGLVL